MKSESFLYHRAGRRRPTRGSTLLEIVVSAAVVLLVLGAVVLLAVQVERAFADQITTNSLSGTQRRVLDRLTTELRQAVPATIAPPLLANSRSVRFQKVDRIENGISILGPPLTFSFDGPSNGLRFTDGLNPAIGVSANLIELRFNSVANGIQFTGQIGVRNRGGNLVIRAFDGQAAFRN